MKYWAYANNEVQGPFEKEQLAKLPNFTVSSLICPQTQAGSEANGWKEASTFPEVSAILTLPAPVPSKPQYPPSESPLALTMRGSLISDPVVAEPAAEPPASAAAKPQAAVVDPVPAPATPKRPAESPLALTMRGSLISDPEAAQPAAATPAAFSLTPINVLKPAAVEPPEETPKPGNIAAGQGPDPRLEPLKLKADEMGAALVSIRKSQAQLLDEVSRLESAVAEMKILLSSEPTKK